MVATQEPSVNPGQMKDEHRDAIWGSTPRTDNTLVVGYLVGRTPGHEAVDDYMAAPWAARALRRDWKQLVDAEWLRLVPLFAFGSTPFGGIPAREGVPHDVQIVIDHVAGTLHFLGNIVDRWPNDYHGAPMKDFEETTNDAWEISYLTSVITMLDPALMPPDYAPLAEKVRAECGEYPNNFHGRMENALHAMMDAYHAATGEERFS